MAYLFLVFGNEVHQLQILSNIFFAWLHWTEQTLCLFRIFAADLFFLKRFPPIAKKIVNWEVSGTQTTSCASERKRDNLLELWHVFPAETSQQYLELIGKITLPRNTLLYLLEQSVNAKYLKKNSIAFTYCEIVSGMNTEHREDQVLKMFTYTNIESRWWQKL